MAKLNAGNPWADEPARQPAPSTKAKQPNTAVAAEVVDEAAAAGYNLRLVLDSPTLAKLRRVAAADGRPLRVMALRLLRAQLDQLDG